MAIDADGLNALAPAGESRGAYDLLRRETPTVVTPHPGEMARLVGKTTADVQTRRLETARGLAVETGCCVVLKGRRTIVADTQGRAAVNPTGNPGMATGGTGDVLAGMVGALLARGDTAWLAATAAVYAHGLAGDRAAARTGAESLVASDLIAALPEALRLLTGGR
jgi:NAD(P)H-hydrate epimerase